mgnify:CR=1 FL=1
MSKIKTKADKYLAENKAVEKVFGTSDGFLFGQKQSALAHAKTLEDKALQTFGRTEKVTALSESEKEAEKVAADKKAALDHTSKAAFIFSPQVY